MVCTLLLFTLSLLKSRRTMQVLVMVVPHVHSFKIVFIYVQISVYYLFYTGYELNLLDILLMSYCLNKKRGARPAIQELK